MRAFRVDTDHIRTAVDNIKSAADNLNGGRDTIDAVDGRVDIDMGDFPYCFRSEFEIIRDMLTAFEEALNKAADGYEKPDQEMHDAWTAPPQGASNPNGGQQAV
jgi:hypothetical protein